MIRNSQITKWLDIQGFVWIFTMLASLAFITPTDAQVLTANDLLNKSIKYHDPDGEWSQRRHLISLSEKRPDGTVRKTNVTIELTQEYFQIDQKRDEHHIVTDITKGTVQTKVDGKVPNDSAIINKYRLDSKRRIFMRDYYTYLYGLPMKLRDPGTQIDPKVLDTSFQGKSVYGLKVTYSPEVGKDIWYFYFDKSNYALSGYRFYHDESANDGEYITLDGEAAHGNFKIPRNRKWFTHKEDKFLGEDSIVEIQ